uniref:Uncharacterized protein n=1 Tax=Oryza barthii TaxID=65489 RepID=A0A0D3G3A6_9ORYZ
MRKHQHLLLPISISMGWLRKQWILSLRISDVKAGFETMFRSAIPKRICFGGMKKKNAKGHPIISHATERCAAGFYLNAMDFGVEAQHLSAIFHGVNVNGLDIDMVGRSAKAYGAKV